MRTRTLAAATAAAFMTFPPIASNAQAAPTSAPPTSLQLSRIIGDGMVMQRDARVPVWGSAAPHARVVVAFDGRDYATTSDAAGRWSVTLPAMPAGGPHAMTVAAGAERLAVRDILVGDVWVCSGQSNMEFVVRDAANGAAEAAAARDPQIRHFKVPTSYAWAPSDSLAGGSWAPADPQHAGQFTAVGYFFARDLRKSVDVPIGLLHTSWGGSRIEPWTSREGLGLDERAVARLEADERAYEARTRDSLRARMGGEIPTTDAGLVDGRAAWAEPELDDASWSTIHAPGPWESQGYAGMDGTAWYRTGFVLTADEAKAGVRLGLGPVDDADVSYVNGREVGRTSGYSTVRAYDVPAAALRAGRNVVAVHVTDTGGNGGLTGEPAQLYVEVAGVRRPLAGAWKFRPGAVTVDAADGQHINKIPTLLYNKMVHPLLPYPVKGVLWYQGESNADRYEDAVAYRGLFAGMIRDWRRRWGVGDAPFLWVQLANYMAPDSAPVLHSNWAALRESQSAALALPNTGQAVILDLGDAGNIHPHDKQDVGARLALVARHVAYGQAVEFSGPALRSSRFEDGRVVLGFDHADGLTARGGTLGGFAVAGEDRQFVWADAHVEGTRVVVSSARVPHPVAVRYAWANNPDRATLYNAAGLPAAPFRTDRW
ncbi:MAG TPA: sialate O-acetylesterase [Gemmatirosa sp.]